MNLGGKIDNNSAVSSAITELNKFEVFKGLSRDELERLCAGASIKVLTHRECLFHLGAPAHYFAIVLSGAMKLSKFTAAGDESVMYFSAPGDVIGALVMTQVNSVYPVMVKSMGPSRCIVINRQVYNENWLKNTELVSRIQTQLFSRMQRFQTQQSHSKLPLAAKIAQTLLELVSKGPDSDLIEIPITRKEIADHLGVASESVIRIMSEWTKEGYIEADDKFLRIVRPDVLIDLVGE